MATTLIIYAHPKKEGHNAYILDRVKASLKKRKIKFDLIDLYEDGFDPVLSAKEHYTSGGFEKSEQTLEYQEKIKKANNLIFIYPVWWGVGPAILKGFFDKVLTPRFAYRYQNLPFPIFGLKARPIGLLKGKRAAVFMTIGTPRWIHVLYTRNAQQFIIKWNILKFCGLKTKGYTLGNCGMPLDDRTRDRVERFVRGGLRWLF
jgi:NAD(P)H dehydrogenase (quinone)